MGDGNSIPSGPTTRQRGLSKPYVAANLAGRKIDTSLGEAAGLASARFFLTAALSIKCWKAMKTLHSHSKKVGCKS
jgi:hypothetical protein